MELLVSSRAIPNFALVMNIPDSGLNRVRLLRNSDEKFIMREHRVLPVFLVPPHAVEAQREPVGEREVYRLIEVQLHTTLNHL